MLCFKRAQNLQHQWVWREYGILIATIESKDNAYMQNIIIVIYYFVCVLVHIICIPILLLYSLKKKYRQSLPLRFLKPHCYLHKHYDFWFHACSLGEVTSLMPIISAIPSTQTIFLTVITHTGFTQAQKLFGTQSHITVDYLAFESLLPFVAPTCGKLLVFEAELWLMLFYIAKKRHATTKLVNARISTRSFKRYLALKRFYGYLFSFIDIMLAQTQRDALRLQRLGAKHIQIVGNIKVLTPIQASNSYPSSKRLMILAASTHAKEEEVILQAYKKCRAIWMESKDIPFSLQPESTNQSALHQMSETASQNVHDLAHIESESTFQDNIHTIQNKNIALKDFHNPLLVMFPRHPERFQSVFTLCASEGKTQKWSDIQSLFSQYISQSHPDISQIKNQDGYMQLNPFDTLDCEILLIDILGELINFYTIGDIVILGGAFEPIGGHNPLEPARFHNILISGKEIFNQKALFACIKHYYLVDKNKLFDVLLESKKLQHSSIDINITNNMIPTILA